MKIYPTAYPLLIVIMLSILSSKVMATSSDVINKLDLSVSTIQQQWTVTNYALKGDEQIANFESLINMADQIKSEHPDSAIAWLWSGIVNSSFAGAKGGLGALSLAKRAKSDFEKSLQLDEKLLQGSAYASLGLLYHKVPGWPIAFGDDDVAEKMLKKSLAINPQGIDINYFYGEYLYDEREYNQAKEYLLAAQKAPLREGWQKADSFRQQDIEKALFKVLKKIKQ